MHPISQIARASTVFSAAGGLATAVLTGGDVQTSLTAAAIAASVPISFIAGGLAGDMLLTPRMPDEKERGPWALTAGITSMGTSTALAIGAATGTLSEMATSLGVTVGMAGGMAAGLVGSILTAQHLADKLKIEFSPVTKAMVMGAGALAPTQAILYAHQAAQAADASITSIATGAANGGGLVLASAGAIALAAPLVQKGAEQAINFIKQGFHPG